MTDPESNPTNDRDDAADAGSRAPADRPPESVRSAVHPWRTRAWILGIAVLCLGPIYYAVQVGVRAHVTHEIVKNEDEPLPDFRLETIDGEVVTTADLRGKWTILHFFRSQCPSCLAEADELHELVAGLDERRVRIYGVLLDRVQGYEQAMTERTLERLDYDHPILVADEAFVDAFHGSGWAHVTPVAYVADPDGVVRYALRGYRPGALAAVVDRIAEKIDESGSDRGS